jgi:hypothetical protein
MWQKFGAGIWEALAKRYPDIDMNYVRTCAVLPFPGSVLPITRTSCWCTLRDHLLFHAHVLICACLQYAPKRGFSATIRAEPTSAPAVVHSSGNPFAAATTAAPPAPAPAPPAPAALATTADVSAGTFAAVPESAQIEAIRRLYTVVNPDKMSQVCGEMVELECVCVGGNRCADMFCSRL